MQYSMPTKEDMAYLVGEDETPEETPASEESSEKTTDDDVQNEYADEADKTEEEENSTEDEENNSESEEEDYQPKQSRAEKRIQQLSRDKKELLKQTSHQGSERFTEDFPRNQGSVLPWEQQEQQEEARGSDEFMELSPEQLDELIDRRLAAREHAAEQHKMVGIWLDDYDSTIKSNPELNPDSPEFNPELDAILTEIVANPDGTPKLNVKVSEVLAKLQKSMKVAEKQGAEKASLKLARQVEESAIAPGASDGEDDPQMTDDEIKRLRTEEPSKYMRLVKEGKIL
jgi:hypothetical protein